MILYIYDLIAYFSKGEIVYFKRDNKSIRYYRSCIFMSIIVNLLKYVTIMLYFKS